MEDKNNQSEDFPEESLTERQAWVMFIATLASGICLGLFFSGRFAANMWTLPMLIVGVAMGFCVGALWRN